MPLTHPPSHNPHGRRWMLFVDGENFTYRGQEVAKQERVELQEGIYYKRDVFLWIPGFPGTRAVQDLEDPIPLQPRPVRSYYYTSITGDDDAINAVHDAIQHLRFAPRVLKRTQRGVKAKGVDIMLTTELLSNAYMDNYDVAFLATGDGDFLPAIQEVQRLGKRVHTVFFKKGLNERLMRGSDFFIGATEAFTDQWRRLLAGAKLG